MMETQCRYFLQGYCKFGDECRFLHNNSRNNRNSRVNNGYSYYEDDIYFEDDRKYKDSSRFIPKISNRYQVLNEYPQNDDYKNINQATKYRYNKVSQQDNFPVPKNDKFHYYKQNNPVKPSINDLSPEDLLLILNSDMKELKDSKMWILSSYALMDSKKSFLDLEEYSFEEIKYASYSDPSSLQLIQKIFTEQLRKINIFINPDANEKINLLQAIKDSLQTDNKNASLNSMTNISSNINSFQIKNSVNSNTSTSPIIFGASPSTNIFQSTQQNMNNNGNNIFPQINNQIFPNLNTHFNQKEFLTSHQPQNITFGSNHNANNGFQFSTPAVTHQVTSESGLTNSSGDSNSAYTSISLLSQMDINQYNSIDFDYVPFKPPSIEFI